jgi:hypothetical protein
MRYRIVAVGLLGAALVGCATSPLQACAELLTPSSIHLPQPPVDAQALEPLLARPRESPPFNAARPVHREWFQDGSDLLVCTLPHRHADACSAIVTKLSRVGDTWIKVGDDNYII